MYKKKFREKEGVIPDINSACCESLENTAFDDKTLPTSQWNREATLAEVHIKSHVHLTK